MRDHLFFFLNGQKVRVSGRSTFEMLAPFLRRERSLTGTKIACAHGACGSCSVLLGKPKLGKPGKNGFEYAPINSCIFPLFACDGAHIITVEGLNGPAHISGQDDGTLSAVQKAMVECHGAQCGFCTPGIVVTLTAFHEAQGCDQSCAQSDRKNQVEAALEGNLCRCTGYTPIIEAGLSVETADLRPLNELYDASVFELEGAAESVEIRVGADELEGEQLLFMPRSLAEAASWKASHPDAVVIAGATEVGVAMSVKGLAPREILSLARIEGLDEVTVENGALVLGARASWTAVAAQVGDTLPELAALLKRWGSPQLRNAGTVAGSIVGASPISDSLPLLLVSEARLELVGASGLRQIAVAEFVNDRSLLRADELIGRVIIPLPTSGQKLRIFKVSKRRAFDRSIVSAAFLLTLEAGNVAEVKIAFGGVGATAMRLPKTEAFLQGKVPDKPTWREAGLIARGEISPVSDYAADSEYKSQLVANLLRKFGSE